MIEEYNKNVSALISFVFIIHLNTFNDIFLKYMYRDLYLHSNYLFAYRLRKKKFMAFWLERYDNFY
jgi:hypothetical protein